MTDNRIELTIVTPERAVVDEAVDELQIPGSEGYFGVLPGHAPLFSELKVGEVAYRKGDRWSFLAVAWDSLKFSRTTFASWRRQRNAHTTSISIVLCAQNRGRKNASRVAARTWTTGAL